jgi:hypothetical protein
MNFKLDHHNRIISILECFNSDVLKNGSAYFGGGTILALDFKEYRWSKDVDFITSVPTGGYKYLRTLIFDQGHEGLFSDNYGIRMTVIVDGIPIKTEIIAENRFHLDPPRYIDWCPVPCLSLNDCFTSKLLANCDRYMDASIESRDLIDLAVLRLHSAIPDSAINKAEKAYEVIRPLKKAIELFQKNPERRQKFFEGLQVDKSWISKIIDGIDLLCVDFDLPKTQRAFQEQHDIFAE